MRFTDDETRAIAEWRSKWSAFLERNPSYERTDEHRPWVDVFGDDALVATRVNGELWIHRPPVWGYDVVAFRWNGSDWIDEVNAGDGIEAIADLLDRGYSDPDGHRL